MPKTCANVVPVAKLPDKVPIVENAFYTRNELQAMKICSWITLLRAEKDGRLIAHRGSGRILYMGKNIISWLGGGKDE